MPYGCCGHSIASSTFGDKMYYYSSILTGLDLLVSGDFQVCQEARLQVPSELIISLMVITSLSNPL